MSEHNRVRTNEILDQYSTLFELLEACEKDEVDYEMYCTWAREKAN